MATDRLNEYANIVDAKARGKVTSWSLRETEENWNKAVPPEPEVIDEMVLCPSKEQDPLREAVLVHLRRAGMTRPQMSLDLGKSYNYLTEFMSGRMNGPGPRQLIREYLAKYDYNKKFEPQVPELPLRALVEKQAAEISALQGMLASIKEQMVAFDGNVTQELDKLKSRLNTFSARVKSIPSDHAWIKELHGRVDALVEFLDMSEGVTAENAFRKAQALEDRVAQLDARIANLPSGQRKSDDSVNSEIESLRQQVEALTANQNDLAQYTRRLDDALVEIGELVIGNDVKFPEDPHSPGTPSAQGLMSVSDVCQSLGVSRTTLKTWMKSMNLGEFRGTNWLLSESDVNVLREVQSLKEKGYLLAECYRMALGAPVDFQEPVVPETVTPEEFQQAVTEVQQPWYKRLFGGLFHA